VDNPHELVRDSVEKSMKAAESWLIAIRRDIHAHPELGFETTRTAALVAAELRKLGLYPQEGVGRTGVVAELVGALPGPRLLIRADMDALPIDEQTGLPFSSTIPGTMHACGHDIHTATLLGVAKLLVEHAERIAGTVRLVFQPAEETTVSGAAAMVADGVADDAQMCLSFHNEPELAVGRFGYTPGSPNASCDDFDIIVRGRSAHASRPHQSVDPIVVAAAIIMQLQTVVSRITDPADPVVLSICHVRGGSSYNIIAESCQLQGTFRCRSAVSRRATEASLRRICTGVSAAMGAECDVKLAFGAPALVNDEAVLNAVLAAVARQYGEESLALIPGKYQSEDFSFISERVPGCQILIGSARSGRQDQLHNGTYDPDERCIGFGTAAIARVALDILSPDAITAPAGHAIPRT
jgi:amidohydrolase